MMMVLKSFKIIALLSVLCILSLTPWVGADSPEEQGEFVRQKDMMDGGSVRRNLPRKMSHGMSHSSSSTTGGGGGGNNGGGGGDGGGGYSDKKCRGSKCLTTEQRRVFFDTFWWQSYFDDLKDGLFEPSCSEFPSFNNYVCPCQEDACASHFSSYDYCADYLKLGERFGDNLARVFGNAGPFIDSLKGCVGFVEECCDYPRHCCGKSCLDGHALCDLYTSAECNFTIAPTPSPAGDGIPGPTRKRRATQVEDIVQEVNRFRKLANESFPYDCTILKYFGKDLCPCEKGSYLPKKDLNPWEPNPWENEKVSIAFCNHVAPGCPHCEPFVETCCDAFEPPYYALPFYYTDD